MPTDTRTNTSGLVVGLLFVGLGVALLLDRLGIADIARLLEFWPLAIVLIGLSLVVQAVRQPSGGPPAPPVRFPVGAVIWLILLGVFFTNVFERRGDARRDTAQGDVRLFAVLGGDRRTVVSDRFRTGEMTSLMGGTVLDLRQATVEPGQQAVVDLFTVMGGATLFVPRDWIVDNQVIAVMGGSRDDRGAVPGRGRRGMRNGRGDDAAAGPVSTDSDPTASPDADRPPAPPDAIEREDDAPSSVRPRVVVRGFVMMGGLVIRS